MDTKIKNKKYQNKIKLQKKLKNKNYEIYIKHKGGSYAYGSYAK